MSDGSHLRVVLADGSPAVLLFWVAAVIISSILKKRNAPKRPGSPVTTSESAPKRGMMDELRRAMDELKRAELQQQAREQAPHEVPSPRAIEQERQARAYLEKQKARAPLPKRVPIRRPVRPLESHDDFSSEVLPAGSPTDYDDEAERLVAKRIAAADRGERVNESSEELSSLQKARRESRQEIMLGGSQEHAEWHREIGDPAPAAPPVKKHRTLARFGDGTAKGALILSEIFGQPVSSRE